MFSWLKSARFKLAKIVIAIFAAFVLNGLFFFFSKGNIELIPIDWFYDNTSIFISLVALYITVYTYISIDRVSEISQMEGNPLEDKSYFGSIIHKIEACDAMEENEFIANIKHILEGKLNNSKNPYRFSNTLQYIIDTMVLYASISNQEKVKLDTEGKDFKTRLMTDIQSRYEMIKNKFFVSSKSLDIMKHSINLIEAILYYQQKNEYDEEMDFDLLLRIDDNQLVNRSSKTLYFNYYGLYHQRSAIQMIKKALDINIDRLFTVDGIKQLVKIIKNIDKNDKLAILIKLEDALISYQKALRLCNSSDIWKAYVYLNLSRVQYLHSLLTKNSSNDWLVNIDKAIDYRWRINQQLSYIHYQRYIKKAKYAKTTRDIEKENELRRSDTFLKKYYKYQESFAKVIKYSILIATNQDIYDSKNSLLCPNDSYHRFEMDLPNEENEKLSDFINNLKIYTT